MGDGIIRVFGLKQLVEASRRITTHLEMDRVLSQIVGTLTSELGATYALIWIVERGGKCHDCDLKLECLDREECLHLKAWGGPRDYPEGPASRIPVGVLKIGLIAQSKAPYITNDVISDPMLVDPAWVQAQGVKSFAGFPLVYGDRLLGVLGYYSDQHLAPELADILSCFAHQSATAIEDARQHEQLRESEERYRALIDGAIDAVIIFGLDGCMLNASHSACQLLGYGKEDLMAMNVRELDIAPEGRLSSLMQDLVSGGAVTYETAFVTNSGDHLQVEVRAGTIRYGGGLAIQAFVRDVSERKKLERQKADLISMFTHDLKGPLSIILGYAEVIEDQYVNALPDFVKEGMRSINQSGTRLLSMIDNYLNLSRLEAGMLKMEKQPVSLNGLLKRSMDTVIFKAEEKRLKLRVDCPDDMPRVPADPKHLERAVTNLLTNAVAYTPRGGTVTLSCRLDAGKGAAKIAVEDTGIGISSNDLPMIFNKYYRAAGSGVKGTGLGLAIVKSVVEGHGGTLSVESVVGAGSTFTITLPLR